jgi:hypothetical protein
MLNDTVLAAATETVEYTAYFPESVSARIALWHETESVLNRGNIPDHLMSLIVEAQDKLLHKIIDAPCATDTDLAAKFRLAALMLEDEAGYYMAEPDMIESTWRDYQGMCKASQASRPIRSSNS